MRLGVVLSAVLALVVGAATFASAASHKSGAPKAVAAHKVVKAHTANKATKAHTVRKAEAPGTETESASEAGGKESAAEEAAQKAACSAAGITSDNVDYDEATGKCSVDTGDDSSSDTP
jgi:hypothetical protein